jgi:hypothetical protein
MNGIRKLFIINLGVLIVLGKLLLALFTKISNGVRYIDIVPTCDGKSLCDYDEFKKFVLDKSLKDIEVLVNTDPCYYRECLLVMNDKALFMKKLKLRIFFFTTFLVILVNLIISYMMYIRAKRHYQGKIEKIYKKYILDDYIIGNELQENEAVQNLSDKKNN